MQTTPKSSADDHSSKRMRLGTRSCTNCRKRKVRCIFTENNKACTGCEKYQVQCIPQRPAGSEPLLENDQSLQQRLQDLEGMVRHICSAIDLDIAESSMSNFESRIAEALKHIQRTPAPSTEDTESRSGSEIRNSDTRGAFADAPLINLFNNSLTILSSANDDDEQWRTLSIAQNVQSCVNTLKPLLPAAHDLVLVLHATVKYWEMWNIFPSDFFPNLCTQTEKVGLARGFIDTSINSKEATTVAKAILFVALCLQQIPSRATAHISLSSTPGNLINAYLSVADRLLTDDTTAKSTSGIECLMSQGRLYINMGKPLKAWLSHRRALDLAILLRFHHLEWNPQDERIALWAHIWQSDRQLSLILGVPCGIPSSHLKLSEKYTGPVIQSPAARMMQGIATTSGHINDRNQIGMEESYPTTLQLDIQLKGIKAMMPLEWWITNPGHNVPVHVCYNIQSLKMYYYSTEKLLHMPYMLKSWVDQKYQYHRVAALEASRESVKCYQALRDGPRFELLYCDLMDFLVFSSAITLAIDLLSRTNEKDSSQDMSDWQLIRSLTAILHHVSIGLECNVAAQAAQLLDYLTAVNDGTFSGTEEYEAFIPYFGKIRIGHPIRPKSMLPGVEDLSAQTFNTVEIDANYYWQSSPGDYIWDAELGIDWSTIVPDQENYEWNQTFENLT
jgi:hypothetical protein